MQLSRIKLSVFINYFLFGILLNSVGTVILQVQRYWKVTESAASILEMFKDFTIAGVSFLVASFITRIGYKKSMLIGLAAVAAACFIVPAVKTFIAVKLLFAVTGASFALIKISVFGTLGLVSNTDKEHLSLMSFLESVFMVGVLSGYFIFSIFIDDKNDGSDTWFNVYYALGAMYIIALLLLLTSPLDESGSKAEVTEKSNDFADMLRLIVIPFVTAFIVCAFIYVLIEQSIMSWLPTFNNKVLHIPSSFSIIITGIMAASTALGRFVAGFVLKRFNWFAVLVTCLLCAAVLVITALPLANSTVSEKAIIHLNDIPVAAYIFPMIGFMLAPVYPTVNSVILASLPKSKHGSMSGLIVVFSALGGTLGSVITGFIFQHYGGEVAFYFSLIPIGLLITALYFLKKAKQQNVAAAA